MDDPLEPLFGQKTLDLYRGRKVTIVHGAVERLPAWMRSGPLSSIEQLCRDFSGPLQAAQGRTRAEGESALSFVGAGGQTPVSAATPTALLRLGLSVHFGDLERTVPQAAGFLRAVERAVSVDRSMRLSAFANAPGSGLPLHHDTYDQLLIHLIGKKTISYRERRDVDYPRLSYSPSGPVPRHFESVYRRGFSDRQDLGEAELVTVTLCPGSCLFLPAGTWHRTEDQKEPCLSLTTAMRAPTRLDFLLAAVRSYVAQSEQWRAPVYGAVVGAPSGEEVAHIERLLAELPARLAALDYEALRQSHHIEGIEAGAVDSYPSEEKFECYVRLPSSSIELSEEPDEEGMMRVKVRVFQRPVAAELMMDEGARPVLEWILAQRRVFSVTELAEAHEDFEREDLEVVLSQLGQVGFLRPAPTLSWE